MTDRKQELLRDEDGGWAELHGLLDRLGPGDMEEPGLTEEWTVKDLLAHLGAWWAEANAELERMRFGTFRLERLDIDEINRRFHEASRDVGFPSVFASLHAARNMALESMWKLPELTPHAEEWFMESGPLHYREHLADLERFVKERAG